MEFHLFYGRFGFIGYVYEEEVVHATSDESFERTLAGLFRALDEKGCAYKYTARCEAADGQYWVIERDDEDLQNHTYTVRHFQSWNSQDAPERMNKRQLKALLNAAYKQTTWCNR